MLLMLDDMGKSHQKGSGWDMLPWQLEVKAWPFVGDKMTSFRGQSSTWNDSSRTSTVWVEAIRLPKTGSLWYRTTLGNDCGVHVYGGHLLTNTC